MTPASIGKQQQIERRLLDFVRREVFRDREDIGPDTDLVAAGFDSLSLVSLLLFIEREYGAWIPQNEITAATLANVRSLAAHVLKSLP
jgi:acyl carrier protein